MPVPSDYLDRVYAGVLGKMIGVYLGRPFENWRYRDILEKLGPITYYVHEQLGDPLVVTDDDLAGTFTFPRALDDYGVSADLCAEDIGRAWLNYIIEERSILWWGGAGNSTEHTAWLNLSRGIPAPASGSIEVNGTTVAEQIGAQIFIDGWALVSPGNPEGAAKLARAAGSVSHDGESVNAAVLWAAMEAEAFVSRDVNHLLDTGLSFIPKDSLVARLVADIRRWTSGNEDWEQTRQRIEDNYGYDKYPGNCHVIPNHALMIMALLHAPHDFQRGQTIVNTSGWDTDCNAGNLGCLHGIMLGLEGLDAGPDWRGPVADRLYISTADGGRSVTDAVEVSLWLADLGRKLAGEAAMPAPKNGAQFHFMLPGSVQGFRAQTSRTSVADLKVFGTGNALAIDFSALAPGREAAATTPVFTPKEVTRMRTYDLMASPRIHAAQVLKAKVSAAADNTGPVNARLRLRHYDGKDELVDLDASDAIVLSPGRSGALEWTVPRTGGQPIAEIGIVLTTDEGRSGGRVLIDSLSWSGCPDVTFQRPEGDGDFWRRAWVSNVHFFSKHFPQDIRISQNRGAGMIHQGGRSWTDYTVEADLMLHLGDLGGVVLRVQGQRRYYLACVTRDGELQIRRQRDEQCEILASTPCDIGFESSFVLKASVHGEHIHARIGDASVEASDRSFADGAAGMLVYEGALSSTGFRLRPIEGA
ncbi:ADP-ribosylglycohydrolase family protein [Pararhizobium mangrovi]|uniref:ADP-ribosylglycohydrolase family protein n=1 Tax=Pararhizobium mangrovi TaxID=2590452 RepID=A0A506U9U1_9HYPH|nr:ADP-ribosylglycohydrolase family protein [Pararhizobium mangrovi]TPW30298.1 ADP-ribosylglycohydrolase family protein [Pararhizobium mangrovi]